MEAKYRRLSFALTWAVDRDSNGHPGPTQISNFLPGLAAS
jgi:hypothetical protein